MSYVIHITRAAEQDLLNAVDHLEFVLRNPNAAADLLDEAVKQINSLKDFLESSAWQTTWYYLHGESVL